MRAKTELKIRKIKAIKAWHKSITEKHPGVSGRIEGVDVDDTLEGLTTVELSFILSMIAAASAAASEESRQHWAPKYHAMREAAERATGNADISFSVGLKLVK